MNNGEAVRPDFHLVLAWYERISESRCVRRLRRSHYALLIRDIRTSRDAVDVAQNLAHDLRLKLARVILDRTQLGQVLKSEVIRRWFAAVMGNRNRDYDAS